MSDEFEIFRTPGAQPSSTRSSDLLEVLDDSHTERGPAVLVVDDDEIVRRSLEMVLGRRYRVILCSSGAEAVERVDPSVHAVVLDIKMREKDGFETFLEIKRRFPHLPITFHSAYQDLKDPYDVMNEYRPFGYIVKEGNYRLVVDTVRSAVDYYAQIQEVVRLARELRVLNHDLEERVAERTSAIQQHRRELEQQQRQLERQLRMARQIQQSLLPLELPEIPGARIAFEYRPMMDVSGDFLDVLWQPEQSRLGLFMCDVSGHGVPAAFLASMVKMTLHGWDRRMQDPAAFLCELHRSMRDKIGDNFITATALCVNLDERMVRYANAGHPPPVLLRPGEDARLLPERRPAIVDLRDPDYENHEAQLETGDRLLLYTDGAIEAFSDDGVMLEMDGFLQILERCRTTPFEELCPQIGTSILEHTRGASVHQDDVSLMALELQDAR